MKKILFLLLSTIAMYGQVPADATPLENIQITNNTTDNSATKVNVQSADGTINTISKSDLVNVIGADSAVGLPITGVAGKLYITKDNNKIYTWNGTFYYEFVGAKGDKGDQGIQGIQGVAGLTGLKGDKGDVGLTGSIGLTGAKGDKGDIGLTGAAGTNGLDGAKGDQGIQGLTGDTGLTGATGSQGIQGVKGDKGDQGIQGFKGDTGAKGDTGSFSGDITADQVTETATRKFQTPTQSAYNDATSSIQGQLNGKENAFSKNTAFNKNFGATAGTVAEGNDSRFTDARIPLPNSANYIQNQNSSAQSANMWISGSIRNSQLTLRSNSLEEFSSDSDNGVVAVNFNGYNGGTSRFRNFRVFNGKQASILHIIGSTGAATFSSTVTASPATLDTQLATLGQVNGITDGKVDKVTGKSLISDSEITRLATITNQDISGKENAFSKNTAFNKNFGATAGTVAEGNDSRILAVSTHTHGLGKHNLNAPAFIDGLTSSNFRDVLFGSSAISDNISTSRWNDVPSALSGLAKFGNMLAWSGNDTHAFIATNHNSPKVRVGGGLNNGINWSKDLAFSDGTGANGTWGINISGTAANSTLWNGINYDGAFQDQPIAYILSSDGFSDTYKRTSDANIKSWLGLGSNAYTSTVIPTNTNQLTNGSGYITDISGKFDKTGGTISGNTTVSGTVTASGGFFNSDRRLKNIFKRDGDVAYYTWKDGRDDKEHIGYVAQEVQENHPNQVQADDKGILSVNYVEILVEKIRVLEKRIDQLEKSK